MELKDEFGYSLFSKEQFEKEHQSLPLSSQNELLLQMIDENDAVYHQLVEKNFIEPFLPDEKQRKKKSCSSIEVNYGEIENAKSIEELIFFLPKKEDLFFEKKLALIKCHLRTTIDTYDHLIMEAHDHQEDMVDYLLECRKEIEEKFDFISTYGEREEAVQVEKRDHFSILCYRDQGTNYFLEDLLDGNMEQYDSYYALMKSIQNQTYKGIKRFDHTLYNLYQVRNGSQRIVFDFLDSSTIILVFAFTKKVKNSKKYRLQLVQRVNDYSLWKASLKEIFDRDKEQLLQEGVQDTEMIFTLLKGKDKSLVKGGSYGKNNFVR